MAEASGMETKYHYFAHSFAFSQCSRAQAAGAPRDAVLLAVSSMGFMTRSMVGSYQ